MRVNTATALSVVPGRSQGGRGNPQTVTMRTNTYLAGLIEGAALAQETIEAASRIQTAAGVGSRQLVVHEAGRLGHRATAALAEFRRLAGGLDE